MKHALLFAILFIYSARAFPQPRYSVLITEIMADPGPAVGLPNYEWMELTNPGADVIELAGWRLADESKTSGAFPSLAIAPGESIILCAAAAQDAMAAFGRVVVVPDFPSLDNDGESIRLLDRSGIVIHALRYSSEWYVNDLKREGGWSLEMIDLAHPCIEKGNWRACIDPNGGTPGRSNSIAAIVDDKNGPQLLYTYIRDSVRVCLQFSEPLDSAACAGVSNFQIDNGISCIAAAAMPPFYSLVELVCDRPLDTNRIYRLQVGDLTDCSGNASGKLETPIGRSAVPAAGDVVINEILFNPRPNANDYVELFNRSSKVIDLSELFLANRNTTGGISSITQITNQPIFLYPDQYLVITKQKDNLVLNYFVPPAVTILELPGFPSYPDDAGYVILLDQQGAIIDEVPYSEDWHFPLLTGKEGVALERLDPGRASGEAGNWHSAAMTAGYGTPGYRNSQWITAHVTKAILSIDPLIFSPDNDGIEDVTVVNLVLNEAGFVGNITIYNASGTPVRKLASNAILGLENHFTWDGLNDNKSALPAGQYIMLAELFNLQGKLARYRKVAVLARRFR